MRRWAIVILVIGVGIFGASFAFNAFVTQDNVAIVLDKDIIAENANCEMLSSVTRTLEAAGGGTVDVVHKSAYYKSHEDCVQDWFPKGGIEHYTATWDPNNLPPYCRVKFEYANYSPIFNAFEVETENTTFVHNVDIFCCNGDEVCPEEPRDSTSTIYTRMNSGFARERIARPWDGWNGDGWWTQLRAVNGMTPAPEWFSPCSAAGLGGGGPAERCACMGRASSEHCIRGTYSGLKRDAWAYNKLKGCVDFSSLKKCSNDRQQNGIYWDSLLVGKGGVDSTTSCSQDPDNPDDMTDECPLPGTTCGCDINNSCKCDISLSGQGKCTAGAHCTFPRGMLQVMFEQVCKPYEYHPPYACHGPYSVPTSLSLAWANTTAIMAAATSVVVMMFSRWRRDHGPEAGGDEDDTRAVDEPPSSAAVVEMQGNHMRPVQRAGTSDDCAGRVRLPTPEPDGSGDEECSKAAIAMA